MNLGIYLNNNYKLIQNKLILLYAFFIPLSLDIMRILAISIILVGLLQIKNNKRYLQDIIDIALKIKIVFLLSILLLSLLWTDFTNIQIGFKYITRYWYILPLFFIFININRDYIPKIISSFLLGMMISELLSYSVFFELIHIPHISHTDPSVFMHHTLYSVFLAFTVGILIDRILTTDTTLKQKLIYIFFSLTITANLFINAGRTGQVIFIFILISVLISKSLLNLKTILSTISIAGFIFYISYSYSPNFQYRFKQTIENINHISYDTPIGSRIGLNIVAKDIILENPILGVGVGDYLSKKVETIDKKYTAKMQYVKSLEHYHNQYAEFMVIGGILGLIAYLSMWWSIAKISIKNKHIKTIKFILIVSFLLASLTDAFFHLNRPLSLFALFVGLILAQNRYEEQKTI